ncbi:Gfo/Idh/MocA family protein [Sphingomonas bacterium]|uniref:Gfo/Idh/MocA family protein n=1 Tax=Sphingomonas bacterium TaxID=1895847 RepID=UPI001C2CE911|nr:Gfo/Idh/MocA family oxidoreductase [Sphingomonas bacterium]
MPLRVALIGTGFGARVVAGCYRDAGMTVDIVSPRDAGAVRAACAGDVDLVSIHSPPFLHADHVGLALDHGRNLLCDKPFGTSADQARRMLDRATAAGVLHFLNFEFRYDPPRLALKALLDDGVIGAVRHVHWTAFSSGSRVPLRPYGWLFDEARGGGWIGAFGSHVFDALRWLVGEVEDAHGETRTDIARRPDAAGVPHDCTAEDAFVARLTFASGATALIDTAFAAPANLPPRMIFIGSEGMIEATGSTRIAIIGSGEDRVIDFEPFAGDPHLPAMRPWAAAVRDSIIAGRQIEPCFADGLACAEIMDRVRAGGG